MIPQGLLQWKPMEADQWAGYGFRLLKLDYMSMIPHPILGNMID